MKKSILREALRISKEELSSNNSSLFMHWSFIVQDNQIIEWSYNRKADPPKYLGYHHRFKDDEMNNCDLYRPIMHAEYHAYKRAKGLLDKDKTFEVINIRLNRRKDMRNSAPCSCCFRWLTALGCKRFHFTTDMGWGEIKAQ